MIRESQQAFSGRRPIIRIDDKPSDAVVDQLRNATDVRWARAA